MSFSATSSRSLAERRLPQTDPAWGRAQPLPRGCVGDPGLLLGGQGLLGGAEGSGTIPQWRKGRVADTLAPFQGQMQRAGPKSKRAGPQVPLAALPTIRGCGGASDLPGPPTGLEPRRATWVLRWALLPPPEFSVSEAEVPHCRLHPGFQGRFPACRVIRKRGFPPHLHVAPS